jgi:hypothetical protein
LAAVTSKAAGGGVLAGVLFRDFLLAGSGASVADTSNAAIPTVSAFGSLMNGSLLRNSSPGEGNFKRDASSG